ncbi:hypothetical protein [Pedobacter psychroterrae]|uniref:Outer membrane protein with beta-barrel domain n=1 Tax=Pedobacter psychroterrae TaxID=2530453 RepID=A0A4R0NUE7_9SPHI|nr:hypothetical protein [Pedobacter psychroterrae]TCD03105.1 hypothetical protein EZ437_03765 [Pedobacter psychroterrae]
MKPSEDEVIAHIKDSLATYEEVYAPGAWEHFSKKESNRPGLVIWIGRLSSAAAVVLIGMALFWFTNSTQVNVPVNVSQGNPQDVAGLKPSIAPEGKEVTPAYSPLDLTIEQSVKKELPVIGQPEEIAKNPESGLVAMVQVPEEVKQVASQLNAATVVASTGIAQEAKTQEEPKKSSFEEFLKDEANKIVPSEKTAKVAVKENNKWAVGVVVSPSFGNAGKLNMGYGVSMGYALSDKVSLNSGISYNEMAASRSVGNPLEMASPGSNSAIAGESKSLESIEQKVTGFDIPIDIKYNLSKSIYANIGVSAFAVIDQQRSNNYIQERLVDRSSASFAGSNEFKTLIVSEKVTENAPESEKESNNYIGFYNFSFGYKQKVAKDKSISIEPFMKVPMREVTKDNLRLMGTGVKLKFDF